MTSRRTACVIALLLCAHLAPTTLASGQTSTAHGSPVTVQDTVTLRRFEAGQLALSPDGRAVAYVLREPNLTKNVNEYALYVLNLDARGSHERGRGREVLRSGTAGRRALHEIGTPFQWLANGQGLLVLHTPAGESRAVLSRIDLASGRSTVAYRSDDLNIEEFSADAKGERLALAGTVSVPGPSPDELSKRGIVISPESFTPTLRTTTAMQTRPELRIAASDGRATSVGRFLAREIKLSPDGRWLAFRAPAREAGVALPTHWRANAALWKPERDNENIEVRVLMTLPHRLESRPQRRPGTGLDVSWPVKLAFDAPGFPGGTFEWSEDSSAYVLSSEAPLSGSSAAADSGTSTAPAITTAGIYTVDVASGAVTPALGPPPKRPYAHSRKILGFDRGASRLIVFYPDGQMTTLKRSPGAGTPWTGESDTLPGLFDRAAAELTVANSRTVVGVEQAPMRPPELYVRDRTSGQKRILTHINPELGAQELGRVERLEWSDGDGRYWGHLIYPVGYTAGRRYPAVILCKGWDNSFIHGGQLYISNYPPQALAGEGFVVFMLGYPRQVEGTTVSIDELAYRSFHSARTQMEQRGLIDPRRVGVMGFSSTSYDVDHLISRPGPGPQWAAAVSVDGGLWNYVTTSMYGGARQVLETYRERYRSDTVDDARAKLLEAAPAWHASNVRTPLLQSYHGYSVEGGLELHNALWIRGKPVEMIWFANGAHNLQLPAEREASMQQTIDWFRFWLQGAERDRRGPRERADALDAQYARWRTLRERHEENERWIREGKDPNVEWGRRVLGSADQ